LVTGGIRDFRRVVKGANRRSVTLSSYQSGRGQVEYVGETSSSGPLIPGPSYELHGGRMVLALKILECHTSVGADSAGRPAVRALPDSALSRAPLLAQEKTSRPVFANILRWPSLLIVLAHCGRPHRSAVVHLCSLWIPFNVQEIV